MRVITPGCLMPVCLMKSTGLCGVIQRILLDLCADMRPDDVIQITFVMPDCPAIHLATLPLAD